MNIAETVWVSRPADSVAAVLGRRPATWLLPFLKLAWLDGEFALRTRTGALPHAEPHGHRIRLGRPEPQPDGSIIVGLNWRVRPPTSVLAGLRGDFVIGRVGGSSTLTLLAHCEPAPDGEQLVGAIRAGEYIVRSLLGHVRAAIEESVETLPATEHSR